MNKHEATQLLECKAIIDEIINNLFLTEANFLASNGNTDTNQNAFSIAKLTVMRDVQQAIQNGIEDSVKISINKDEKDASDEYLIDTYNQTNEQTKKGFIK